MGVGLTDLMQLNKSHIKPASLMLSQAFWNYPVSVYSYPRESERDKLLPYRFQCVLYYCIRYGEVYATSPKLEGVAAWFTSHYFPMTTWRLLRSVPLSILFNLGRSESTNKTRHLGDYIDAVHQRLVPSNHIFLQTIGVTPESQGRGYASSLLRLMFDKIDKKGLPCYLETTYEQNVSLYEHFGFIVIEESTIPDTKLTNWAMLREV